MIFRKTPSVDGVSLPPRRFTAWAAFYFLLYFCAPVLGVALSLDIALYFLFTRLLDRCYGVMCLLG